MSGFIFIHRQILDWEWYSDIKTKTLFIHCLLKANWEDKNWKATLIKKGSFVTSTEQLSKETKLSIREVRTAISRLEVSGEITKKTTSKFTLLTVVNWEDYQEIKITTTNKRQTKDKQTTTTKEYNNYNNKNILNNSLMSEIKISDDGRFFKFENLEIEAEENQIKYFQIAESFRLLFIKNLEEKGSSIINQTKKANFKNYANIIKLIIESDNATIEQLQDAYRFIDSKKGEFWKSNILSISKLREKLPELVLKQNTKEIKPVKIIQRN